MTDEDNRVTPLREVLRRATSEEARVVAQEEAAVEMDHNIRAMAEEKHKLAIQHRTEARQDAATVVARARARRGDISTNWGAFDADAIHLIADLLLKLQGQEPKLQGQELTLVNPAFAPPGPDTRKASLITAQLDEAMHKEP